MAETAYAHCGELSLAYRVHGDGPVDMVVAGSFVSNVELIWTSPESKAFFDHLAKFSRLVVFDKAGVGLSDPVPRARSVEERAAEIEAVMDAAGVKRAALVGLSEGGPAAIVFAASRPDRVHSLILIGTGITSVFRSWDEVYGPIEPILQRCRAEFDDRYVPSVQAISRLQQMGRSIKERWGTGEAMEYLLPSVSRIQLGLLERMSASPGMAIATMEAGMRIDVRSVLPTISVPTLLLHAKDDLVPIEGGRYVADHIPGARIVEFDGRDHAPWLSRPDVVLKEVEELLTGGHHVPPPRRALRSVLFTDLVASTEHASAMGDERWRDLLGRFQEVTAEAIRDANGRLIKSLGDGHLATFDGPAQAISGAQAIIDAAAKMGLDVRAGVHVGECEVIGEDIGGVAVHIAARVMALAGPGEILVSSTVRDLVVGSGIGFDDRGMHELKGVPGQWKLLAVRAAGAPPGSPEARLVSLPTPPMRTGMRRSDRAVASVARRAPIVLRVVTRLLPKGH